MRVVKFISIYLIVFVIDAVVNSLMGTVNIAGSRVFAVGAALFWLIETKK